MLYLANYHINLANCHIDLANCISILQIVILQIVIFFFFFVQHWALNYGLVTRGANVDLKNFPLIRAHLNNLSFENVSKILLS